MNHRIGIARRPGFALLFVLICVGVIALLLITTVRRIAILRNQTEIALKHDQAIWLSSSAMNRAVYKIEKDASYDGETWEPPSSAIGVDAVAVIEVIRQPNDQLAIRVVGTLSSQEIRIASSEQNRVMVIRANPESGDK